MDKNYDILSDETPKAYGAFLEFLQLGPERTVAKLAKTLGKPEQGLYVWSSEHNWSDRSAAYDREMFDSAMESRRSEIAERQYEILDAGYQDYLTLLDKWRTAYSDPKKKPSSKTLKEAANSRLAIENLGRKAAGLPNTYLQTSVDTVQTNETIKLAWSDNKVISAQATSVRTEKISQDQDEDDKDDDQS